MHVALRERDRDAFGVEGEFGPLDQIEAEAPEIGGAHPGARGDVDAAVAQFRDHHQRRRFGVGPLVLGDQPGKDVFRLAQIVAVANPEHEIHPTAILSGKVGDVVIGQGAVGHDDPLVVWCQHDRAEDLDFANGAGYALRLDEVAHAKGSKQQDQHAPGEVGQAALQRESDRQSRCAEHRNEGGGCDADHRRHADQQQGLETQVQEAQQKTAERAVGTRALQALLDHLEDTADDPPADHQHEERQRELGQEHEQLLDGGVVEDLKLFRGQLIHELIS